MARPKKRGSRTVVVKQNVAIEVRQVPFTPLESVRHFDIARLSRTKSARVEIGWFESGCCRRNVSAVVKNGWVTKLEADRCEHPVRMTPEMKELILAARRKLGRSTFRSAPVGRFFGDPRGLVIDISFCFIICIFGYCLLCCYDSDPNPSVKNGCDFGPEW